MTRECSGKDLTELNPGLSSWREGTVGSWNTIFRSSSFGNLVIPIDVRMRAQQTHASWQRVTGLCFNELTALRRCLTIRRCAPTHQCLLLHAQEQRVEWIKNANSLPVGCHPRQILVKLMHDSGHLLPHVDVPINIVFEDQSGRNFLINNPGKVQSAIPQH